MNFDPQIALAYLEKLRSGRACLGRPASPLLPAINRLDRPARARGLTVIKATAFPGSMAAQVMFRANPNRRMFCIISLSGNTNIAPEPIAVSSTVGWQIAQTASPEAFKEEDFGALITYQWSAYNAGLIGSAFQVFEEIYIS